MGAVEIGAPRWWRWSAILVISLALFSGAFAASQEEEGDDEKPSRADSHGDPIPEKALLRMGTLQNRVPGGISALAFSPDGETLATGGNDDSAVRIWDVESGEQRKVLDGHEGGVSRVAFTSGGSALLTVDGGSRGGAKVRRWDVESGSVRSMSDLPFPFASILDISPDGTKAAAAVRGIRIPGGIAGSENPIFVIDVESGGAFQILGGHDRSVNAAAFSRDGRTLVSGGGDNRIRIWDVESSTESDSIEGPKEADPKGEKEEKDASPSGVGMIALSPDAKTIASFSVPGTGDASIRLWDAATGEARRELKGGKGGDFGPGYAPRAIVFSGDGTRLACAGNDSTIRVWNVETGEVVVELEGYSGSTLAFSPDGKTIAGGAGAVLLLDAATGERRREAEGHEAGIGAIALSPDGKTVASGGFDQSVHLWNLATGDHIDHLEKIGGGSHAVEMAATGKYLVAVGTHVRVWDVEKGKVVIDLEGDRGSWIKFSQEYRPDIEGAGRGGPMEATESKGASAYALSPAGDQFAAGFGDGVIRFWKLGSRKRPRQARGHGGTVIAVAFSPDGKTLASWGADGVARIWKTSSGKRTGEVDTHGAGILCLADFSPSLDRLAYGDRKGIVHLWDMTNGREIVELQAHESRFTMLRFSPDGGRLVTRGVNLLAERQDPFGPPPESNRANARIPVWDVELATELFDVPATPSRLGPQTGGADDGAASAVAFTRDGRYFASAGRDPKVRLREVASGKSVLDLEGHAGEVGALAFSDDGKTLLSGSSDTTLLLWDLRPQGLPAEGEAEAIEDGDLDAMWGDLAGESALAAYLSIWRLAGGGDKVVAYIGERLAPIPRQGSQRARSLIRKLDDRDIDVREDAAQELESMGAEAESELRKALEDRLSPEARELIQSVLASLRPPKQPYPSEAIRRVRAVQVLEWIGTPEAKEILRSLGKGSPWASQTREAEAALERLEGAGR